MPNLAPPPKQIVEPDGTATKAYTFWLLSVTQAVQSSPQSPISIPVLEASAAIGTTSLLTATNAGCYRVSWSARIVTPGSISSSLTVTIGHTEDGLSIVQSGAALTTNTVLSVQSGTVLCLVDGSTPITVSTAYASNAAGMAYSLYVLVELVE